MADTTPHEIQELHEKVDCVVVPEPQAGSVVIFTEALCHGTAPWTGKHQRRSLLFKYTPGWESWNAEVAEPPQNVELTFRQRRLFEPPYFPHRPSILEIEAAKHQGVIE